jgi:hypothetical protein
LIVDNTTNANIPTGTTVVAVLSPTRLVMSKNALVTNSLATHVTIGGAAVHSFTTSLTVGAIGDKVVTTTAGFPFSSADVGRVFSGATSGGITNGTTITAVAPNGLSATLSTPAVGTLAAVSGTLFAAAPVPNGAYLLTVVSNGAVDANTTDPTYDQSAVTSGSTFTVAPA